MLLMVATAVAANKKFTLVIDAGHGGNDTGAIGALTKEKTINLNVALAFGRLVERNCPDVKVVYTRKTDVFIPLHTRADIANSKKADLFISIHTNALPKGRVSRGIETYTLGMHRAADNLAVAKRENEVILYETDYKQRYQGFDPRSSESYIMFEFMQDHNMAQSVELAKFVQKRTCSIAQRQNKGVKQAGFLVLRETSMPSCLIELGFISTPDEERFLHSSDGVSLLAEGIYMAFLDYKRKYDHNIVVPLRAETKQEVNIPTVVPQDEVKPKKEEKKQEEKKQEEKKEQQEVTKNKSRIAQELEDAREGSLTDNVTASAPTVPNADSIISAAEKMTAKQEPPQMAGLMDMGQVAEKPEKQSDVKGTPAISSSTGAPVFKVQIMASGYKLKANDPQLKGVKDAQFYQEGGLYKYTVGASEDYNAIYQLRKTLTAKFPQAFIIAFKKGQKVNVQEAIQEYKRNKK